MLVPVNGEQLWPVIDDLFEYPTAYDAVFAPAPVLHIDERVVPSTAPLGGVMPAFKPPIIAPLFAPLVDYSPRFGSPELGLSPNFLPPRGGLSPNLTCPVVGGYMCSAHGVCVFGLDESVGCLCHWNMDDGYWSGGACGQCAEGWYGPTCDSPCPGGMFSICSGNGLCDSGLSGSGRCTCHDRFNGTDCSTCSFGYWGPSCDEPCPGVDAGNAPCNSHGACDELTGLCLCESSGTLGVGSWRGDACDVCAEEFTGVNCDVECPLSQNGTCNHRGVCVAREGQSPGAPPAACICDPYWFGMSVKVSVRKCTLCSRVHVNQRVHVNAPIGPACSFQCPTSSVTKPPCSGFPCDDGASGSGVCLCPVGPDDGTHFVSELSGDCSQCEFGWHGANCDQVGRL